MNLPISKEELDNQISRQLEPCNYRDVLIQARMAFQLNGALEWLACHEVFLDRDEPRNRYVVGTDMKKTDLGFEYLQYGEGETILEAIENAMKVIK